VSTLRHFGKISNSAPSDTSCTFPSIQAAFTFTLPHDIHFNVSRIENGIDIKTPSLIVARRTHSAAVAKLIACTIDGGYVIFIGMPPALVLGS
jgi:hypothetical protein